MNLKVTLTYILTEDDWDVSQLLQDCDSYNSGEAIEIIKTALLDDSAYVIKNADIISVKEDKTSL